MQKAIVWLREKLIKYGDLVYIVDSLRYIL